MWCNFVRNILTCRSFRFQILAELHCRVKGARGEWRGSVLGALYGLVECNSSTILITVARVVLAVSPLRMLNYRFASKTSLRFPFARLAGRYRQQLDGRVQAGIQSGPQRRQRQLICEQRCAGAADRRHRPSESDRRAGGLRLRLRRGAVPHKRSGVHSTPFHADRPEHRASARQTRRRPPDGAPSPNDQRSGK